MGEKSFAAHGNRTCVGDAPIGCSYQLSYIINPYSVNRFGQKTVSLTDSPPISSPLPHPPPHPHSLRMVWTQRLVLRKRRSTGVPWARARLRTHDIGRKSSISLGNRNCVDFNSTEVVWRFSLQGPGGEWGVGVVWWWL